MKKKQVVFVKKNPQIRIFKQAYGLAKTGKYELILVAANYDTALFSKVFDKIIDFGDNSFIAKIGRKIWGKKLIKTSEEINLSKVIKTLDPCIFHVHAEPNIFPKIAIRNSRRPVIYDTYDFYGLRAPHHELDKKELEAEKYCLENADGIVLKFPESILDFFKSEFGYNINSPYLNFADYCLSEYFAPIKYSNLQKNNIHLVYGGVVSPTSSPVEESGNNQYLHFIHKIIDQKISYHLYFNPWQINKKIYSDYIELNKKNPYFHLHNPLSQPSYQRDISQYTYGLQFHDFRKTKHLKPFGETSFGNKFFTYLEAGLPIIASNNLSYNCNFIEGYGVGFCIDLDNIDRLSEFLNEPDFIKYKRNIDKARTGPLKIENNIDRLINFYNNLE